MISIASKALPCRDDKGTSEALAFARIAAATEEELEILVGRSSLAASAASRFISPRNEAAALKLVAETMKEHLGGYARTLEENLAHLKSNLLPSFSPQRSALIVLIGEEQVAHFWIRAYETLLDALQCPTSLQVMQRLTELPSATPEELDLVRYATWICASLQNLAEDD